jgi:hypothetical protein
MPQWPRGALCTPPASTTPHRPRRHVHGSRRRKHRGDAEFGEGQRRSGGRRGLTKQAKATPYGEKKLPKQGRDPDVSDGRLSGGVSDYRYIGHASR